MRVTVFAGHSGSGKTEIAVNRAIRLARDGARVALVDLDTVNHYFRTRIVLDQLQSAGVRVVLPPPGLTNADMPIVSPEVRAVLTDPTWQVLIDLGGDAIGSRVLGQFAEYLEGKADMLLVVNPYRPRTATAEKALTEAADILAMAKLGWTGVLANPNLGPETTAEDVANGLVAATETAATLGVPLVGAAVRRDLLDAVAAAAGQTGATAPGPAPDRPASSTPGLAPDRPASSTPGLAPDRPASPAPGPLPLEPLDIYLDRSVSVERMGGT